MRSLWRVAPTPPDERTFVVTGQRPTGRYAVELGATTPPGPSQPACGPRGCERNSSGPRSSTHSATHVRHSGRCDVRLPIRRTASTGPCRRPRAVIGLRRMRLRDEATALPFLGASRYRSSARRANAHSSAYRRRAWGRLTTRGLIRGRKSLISDPAFTLVFVKNQVPG